MLPLTFQRNHTSSGKVTRKVSQSSKDAVVCSASKSVRWFQVSEGYTHTHTHSIHTLIIKPGMEKWDGKLGLAVRLCKFQTMSAVRGFFPRVGSVPGDVALSLSKNASLLNFSPESGCSSPGLRRFCVLTSFT